MEETIFITIPFKRKMRVNPDGSRTGKLHLKISDCTADMITESRKKIGDVGGVIGGGMEINLLEDELESVYTTLDIWNAFY